MNLVDALNLHIQRTDMYTVCIYIQNDHICLPITHEKANIDICNTTEDDNIYHLDQESARFFQWQDAKKAASFWDVPGCKARQSRYSSRKLTQRTLDQGCCLRPVSVQHLEDIIYFQSFNIFKSPEKCLCSIFQ